jgi:formylglycine-generating enzyme required for sulfatase activity
VPHRIELRKEGYRTVRKTVTPTGRRTIVVREKMLSEFAARLAEAPRRYSNSAGIELQLFEPQGVFEMGAPRHQEGQRANEFQRRVKLRKRFYASRHEITNRQFRTYRGGQGGPDTVPHTGVRWRDAAAFCNWLSEREKLTPFYRIEPDRPVVANPTTDGYRLLTEAEWEWLARRAGKPRQTVFTWGGESVVPKGAGNIADETANGLTRYYVPNYTDGHARAAPVGSYPAEASGLFDLTGNVSEWVHDYYLLLPPAAGKLFVDPVGPAFGDAHVVKGSSWRSGTRSTLRAAFRDGLVEGRDDVGFRIGRYLYGAETSEARGPGGR